MINITFKTPCQGSVTPDCTDIAEVQKVIFQLRKQASKSAMKLAAFEGSVLDEMIAKGHPKHWQRMAKKMFAPPKPKAEEAPESEPYRGWCPKATPEGVAGVPTLNELRQQLDTYLLIKDPDALDIVLGVAATHRWGGANPVWLLVIGPPSGTKTEYIELLDCLPEVHQLSDVTAKTYISCLSEKDSERGKNPSLLFRYPNNIFTFKDLTTILAGDQTKRDAVFGRMTEVADGHVTNNCGNAKDEGWTGYITQIMGVTKKIYKQYEFFSGLGPRFLALVPVQPTDDDLAHFVAHHTQENYLLQKPKMVHMVGEFMKALPQALPAVPDSILDKIAHLSALLTRMRFSVERGKDGEITTLNDDHEMPARAVLQLKKLTQGIALIHGKTDVGEEEFAMVKRVAFDTIPPPRRHILLSLYAQAEQTVSRIAEGSKFFPGYIDTTLQELRALGALEVTGVQWHLTEVVRGQMTKI
jgi:hypothetical protein